MTCGDIKALTARTEATVRESGRPVTAVALFLAMLSLLTLDSAQASSYWAFVPDPPTARAVTWKDPSPRVFTNFTDIFDGPEISGLTHAVAPFNWTSLASAPPFVSRPSMALRRPIMDAWSLHQSPEESALGMELSHLEETL